MVRLLVASFYDFLPYNMLYFQRKLLLVLGILKLSNSRHKQVCQSVHLQWLYFSQRGLLFKGLQQEPIDNITTIIIL